MKFRIILLATVISVATSVTSICIYSKVTNTNDFAAAQPVKLQVQSIRFEGGNTAASDFTQAATTAAVAVVHIKTHVSARRVVNKQPDGGGPFSNFFNSDPNVIPEQLGSGSGVILSDDGYIITNNHVIENADNITVTLVNNKTYKAKVIGADAKSDIAVLKIEAQHLPFLVYGNSDNLQLGQWVLAIGYPWNLDITVTAGIISAKTRPVNGDGQSTRQFLQTDAAVNLGNSGGALVNTSGELVGINTALASPTGAYAGYSYAIPVNMVKKVVYDLIKYGEVKGTY